MKEIDMNNLLSQLRANAAIAQTGGLQPVEVGESAEKPNFSELLQNSIDKINNLQMQAGEVSKSFELGDPNISLAEVMIAREKAGVAFESVLQVRNKLITAYKDIMAMHV